MIFTLLYSSQLLKHNKYRNVYLYAIGMVLYVIIHWLLFSPICENIPYVKKYRSVLYLIASGDIMYVYTKYKDFLKNVPVDENVGHVPIIEEINTPQECCVGDQCKPRTQHMRAITHPNGEQSSNKTKNMCENGFCDAPNEHDMHMSSDKDVNNVQQTMPEPTINAKQNETRNEMQNSEHLPNDNISAMTIPVYVPELNKQNM